MRQTWPFVPDQPAGALESEHASSRFGRHADGVSKAVAEMPPAIACFVRQKLDRYGSVRFPQSLPRPGDLGPRTCRVELRDKRPVQDGEPLAPRTGREQHLDEISGAVSPDIGEIQDER